jgi:hypothetical protein
VTFYVVPIVEGQTEVRCIERLLQRVWIELLRAPMRLQVLPASRGKRDALINPKCPDLANKIEEAHTKLARMLRHDSAGRGLLLLLLDSEGDCPAQLAPKLLEAARVVRSDAALACVLAKRMLESWIVGGASSLNGVNELPNPLPPRDHFEDRNGVAWLEAQLRSQNRTRKYRKTVDAEIFVRHMNLQECRQSCPSFDKLCRELSAWLPQPKEATESSDQEGPSAPEGGRPGE